MGWGNCGHDSQGRPIGYCHNGTCDHPRCGKKIDRGLAFACGGMHGEGNDYCEKYFCGRHLYFVDKESRENSDIQGCVCMECMKKFEKEQDENE